ncbi:ABC transporter substrate-binding protein [Candidatus Uhrbacteria bacterium]|nr:ABC transporter substrate-binding protein [Candidatus Uhrbacteria bacterium]
MKSFFSSKISLAILVIVILLFGLRWYATSQNTESTQTIKLGVITGATGQYAFVGENYTKGVNLALEQWHKDHPDQTVTLTIEDDSFDPKKGLNAFRKLVNLDRVDALINMTSPTIDAMYEETRRINLPIAQGGEQGIEPADDNVFQLLPGNMVTEIALGKYVKEHGFKNVAVFVANNATFLRFLKGFEQGYGQPFKQFIINPDERDYRTFVAKTLAIHPDAVVFLVIPEQGANLVKLIREQSAEPLQYVFDANVQTGFPDYQRILRDTNALNGSIAINIRQANNPQFIEAYKKKYGQEPGIGASWSYDSFELLMRTYAKDPKTWINNMKNTSFESAGGKVEFDEVGVRKPDFFIGTIQNGVLPKQ